MTSLRSAHLSCTLVCSLLIAVGASAQVGPGDGAFPGFSSTESVLEAFDAEDFDNFGQHVDLDGNTLVVGVPLDDDDGSASGSVYVYTRSGGVWTLQQKLTAFDAAELDFFGESVAIDGDDLIVGSFQDDLTAGTDAGSAYIYQRSGAVWSFVQKLVGSQATSSDWFGASVDIDGDRAVVGAPQDDPGFGNAGRMYVFERTAGV
jgi:hypothetical protein